HHGKQALRDERVGSDPELPLIRSHAHDGLLRLEPQERARLVGHGELRERQGVRQWLRIGGLAIRNQRLQRSAAVRLRDVVDERHLTFSQVVEPPVSQLVAAPCVVAGDRYRMRHGSNSRLEDRCDRDDGRLDLWTGGRRRNGSFRRRFAARDEQRRKKDGPLMPHHSCLMPAMLGFDSSLPPYPPPSLRVNVTDHSFASYQLRPQCVSTASGTARGKMFSIVSFTIPATCSARSSGASMTLSSCTARSI